MKFKQLIFTAEDTKVAEKLNLSLNSVLSAPSAVKYF